MTSKGDSTSTLAPLRADGISLERLSEAAAARLTGRQRSDETHRFWASAQRPITSTHREVMQVNFGSERLVNHLTFKVSRFPLVLRAEYQDRNGDWQAFTHQRPPKKKPPHREQRREPVRLAIAEAVPRRVNSARQTGSSQHFGKDHWVLESWRVNPVRTRKIRFVFVRNHRGRPPLDHHDRKVPYSVAMKNLAIGYRVTSRADIPTTTEEWWASSKDILGSQVVYSTYEQAANKAVDGDLDTYWRSEPQPFPFAVVNLHLDLGTADDTVPVIDRFWVDPITTGVLCNVYHSNEAPDDDFDGETDPIPASLRDEVGSPEVPIDQVTREPLSLRLGPEVRTGIGVVDKATRMRYDEPWWVGIDGFSLVGGDDTASRPLISVGTTQVLQEDGQIKVLAQSGEVAAIPLDPTLHGAHTQYRVVVAYHPDDPASNRPAYLRLTYCIPGFEPISVERSVAALANVASALRIGLHPDPEDTDHVPALEVLGLVVKSEALTPEVEEWFLDEGEAFVAEPVTPYDERGTSQNARLRMHPQFRTDANLFGVVGGPGDRFSDMIWTPVHRDYTLRQGYMHVPPTKARYWKFEMTGLLPQVYDNFLTIDRDVLVFPPDIVDQHTRSGSGVQDNFSPDYGVQTTGLTRESVAYTDVLRSARTAAVDAEVDPDATRVLVVKDPAQAVSVASTGWIWSYQPWHTGASAPQFPTATQHRYESIRVKHATKVAFFAGVREIRPFRVDYTFEDDTPEYAEHLLDTAFIDTVSGLEVAEGSVRATSERSEIVSAPLRSYREVRGVQFATQETDAIQVFTDSWFTDPDLSHHWQDYGDATVERQDRANVKITRGYEAFSYADLESLTYEQLEPRIWAQVEGLAQGSGAAEGGITSDIYTPSGAGKLLALAEISTEESLEAPVVLEIVSTYDNRVVAQESRWLRVGESHVLQVAFSPGALTDFRTWAEVENLVSTPTTYEQLDAKRYYELESDTVPSNYYVRVRQQGPSTDTFHVHRVALYDSPIAWFFSNDDGATWWQAIDVRNDPNGVLIFPESDTPEDPTVGRTLRWKAVLTREDATISALHIRPWYGTRARTIEPVHGLDALGPNRSYYDVLPATHKHPMWLSRFNPQDIEDEIRLTEQPPLPPASSEVVLSGDVLVFDLGTAQPPPSTPVLSGDVLVADPNLPVPDPPPPSTPPSTPTWRQIIPTNVVPVEANDPGDTDPWPTNVIDTLTDQSDSTHLRFSTAHHAALDAYYAPADFAGATDVKVILRWGPGANVSDSRFRVDFYDDPFVTELFAFTDYHSTLSTWQAVASVDTALLWWDLGTPEPTGEEFAQRLAASTGPVRLNLFHDAWTATGSPPFETTLTALEIWALFPPTP